MIAVDQATFPLHDLYRFRRSSDGADVVYRCVEIHLTSSDQAIRERGTIVGCRHSEHQDWSFWDGRAWRHATNRISRRFEKLPVLIG